MTNKLNVLLLLQRFQSGGAERQAFILAQELNEKGYNVSVAAFGSKKNATAQKFESTGIPIYSTGYTEKVILQSGIYQIIKKILYSVRFVLFLRSLNADVLLCYTYPANVIGGNLYRLAGIKKAFWNQRDEGRWFTGGYFDLRALKKVNGFISNSIDGVDFLKKFTTRPITKINNGIYIPEEISNKVKPKEFRAVMIANIHGYKDHETLIRAWKVVVNYKPNATLILAGHKGDAFKRLYKMVSELNIDKNVLFPGRVDDIHSLIQTCHLGVFSSKTEGVPNGILECMAVGLPVVSTSFTGAIEALGHEYNYIAEAGNHIQMAEMICKFINNADLLETVGKRNRNYVQQQFSIDKMVSEYEELITN